MSLDKPVEPESLAWPAAEAEVVCPGQNDAADYPVSAENWRRLRLMAGRAAAVYLLLFLGLGLAMSLAGVNPLARDGLMPKLLLVFVGLAWLIALANSLTDLCREQSRNWLRLVSRKSPARNSRGGVGHEEVN